jgi:hypothetical protein
MTGEGLMVAKKKGKNAFSRVGEVRKAAFSRVGEGREEAFSRTGEGGCGATG